MAHIHTNSGEHDQTASAFIVRTDLEYPRLLLHMHKKLGVLLQPGGHVELHENPWQAIRHEIEEETGYEASQLTVLQPKDRLSRLTGAQLHPAAVCQNTHNFAGSSEHRHTDTAYAFLAKGAPRNLPADGESADLRWVSVGELDRLSGNEIFEDVREIGRFVLLTCLRDWEEVPVDEYE
jgi:8-oxo-dGTP pyrophosphatase MutT (NUDIX family)